MFFNRLNVKYAWRFSFCILLLLKVCWSQSFAAEYTQPTVRFERASMAYLDGASYDPNIPRIKQVVIPSVSDGQDFPYAGDSTDIYPIITHNGVLYGVQGPGHTGLVYKSVDGGEHWVQASSNTLSSALMETPEGNLLGWNMNARTLNRSEDGWETTVDVTPQGDNSISPSAQFFRRWSVAVGNGVMMLSEYGPPGALGGRYILRSMDDGVTWSRCFDAAQITDIEANRISHWHTIGYHAGTNRWIACSGDGYARAVMVYSDDDGDTWNVFDTQGDLWVQPVRLFDYGDPVYFLAPEDGYGGLLKLNAQTGESKIVFNEVEWLGGLHYFFDCFKHDGLYYAVHANITSLTPRCYNMGIMVSPDTERWYWYHLFDQSDKAAMSWFAGYNNGKLHFTLQSLDSVPEYRHFQISPAKIKEMQGTVITPAVTNLLSQNNSSVETSSGDWVCDSSGILTRTSQQARTGQYSMHYTKQSSAASNNVRIWPNPQLNLEPGKYYIGSAYVKGTNNVIDSYLYSVSGGAGSSSLYRLVGSDWTKVFTNIFYVTANNKNNITLNFAVIINGDGDFDLYFDDVAIQERPMNLWQMGDVPKAPDRLIETAHVSDEWTDIFAVQTLWFNSLYVNSTIKTWAKDKDNSLTLGCDASSRKFYLIRTIRGVPQIKIMASKELYFKGNTIVKFAVSVEKSGTKVSYQAANAIETIKDDAIVGLLNTEITATYGDFPMIVVTGLNYAQLIPFAISDDHVKAAFNLEEEDCDPGLQLHADINKDCIVDLLDLAVLASEWLISGK
jgi:hypothetical protein